MVIIATSFNVVFNEKIAAKIYSVKSFAASFAQFLVGFL